ncbi:hypothetical protein EUTSA_v10004959mg [Eutrema salsugineum]|uniref:Uncharacterized protein n=1 Tax=Eutrema salsugineum TaxID=72664 RepID=V4K4A5_EUTSA|nr:uncharacterized protein LOC18011797 [Eutrema salsugineum]ESQ32375.1 hypothetical protein EUTSA_v10004959mg [Eutrema salsugineum]
MSNNSPVFPFPQSQHFSDYGFDPQIDYFQVLEEARKHKKENSSIDSIQFKLQKPISKDDLIRRTTLHAKNKKKKRWFWWKNALLFFNWRKWPVSAVGRRGSHYAGDDGDMGFDDRDVHIARARNFRASAGSISGPVYVTESRSGSSTPYRTIRPSLTLTPAIPYLSLRELTMERQQRIGTSSMSGPIYLVT